MNPNPNPMSGMALAPLLQSDFEVPLALLVGASAVGDGSCHTRQVPVGAWAVPVVTPDGCAERPFWVACCREAVRWSGRAGINRGQGVARSLRSVHRN